MYGRAEVGGQWAPRVVLALAPRPHGARWPALECPSQQRSRCPELDRTPCGAAAPRGAGAGARAAAGAARPRHLTCARSRPPSAPVLASSRPRRGRVPSLISPTSRRLAGPLRRALHSAHRNDTTPGRTPGRVAGARKGVFTAYVLRRVLLLFIAAGSAQAQLQEKKGTLRAPDNRASCRVCDQVAAKRADRADRQGRVAPGGGLVLTH
jgi:hypothetical protein